jgi:hypothetical protein
MKFQFRVGDIVRLVFGGPEMIVTKVEVNKISAVSAEGGAPFEEHPRTFTLLRREPTHKEEE